MFSKLTTVKRVAWGFGVLTLVLVLAVTVTLWQVARTSSNTNQLIGEYTPLAESSLRILNGVNDSLANLRGYMLLSHPKFETDRAVAWTQLINPANRQLRRLAELPESLEAIQAEYVISDIERTDPAELTLPEKVALVTVKLSELKTVQEQVVSLANPARQPTSVADANVPSLYVLQQQATPLAEQITEQISTMVDEESQLEPTAERRQLLYQMANFRSAFGLSLSNVRAYLLSGEEEPWLSRYREQTERSDTAYEYLAMNSHLLMGRQQEHWQKLVAARERYAELPPKMIDARDSANWNRASAELRDNAAPRAFAIRQTLTALLNRIDPQVAASQAALAGQVTFLTIMQWTLLGIGLLVALGVSVLIVRNVRRSIGNMLTATQEVSTASTEIASSSQQQLASLNQTATSLNQITTAAEEFKATMQEFADRSRAVQEAADDTAERTTEGRTLTRESAARIDRVRGNAQMAGESVLNLSQQMQRIGEITATVNEIAEQTKLLALNASIEAARAGEDGRGFAVVATQVRELANQSKESAGRIDALITDTQKSMQEVVARIQEGSRLAEDSVAGVGQMSEAFEQIAQAIQQTREAMSQINTGARQQGNGIVELVSSITEIDSGSRESLAAAQQTQAAIASIDLQIKSLNHLMTRF